MGDSIAQREVAMERSVIFVGHVIPKEKIQKNEEVIITIFLIFP